MSDYRTSVHKTLKTKRLTRADLDDVVACLHERKATERFRRFTYDELIERDKLNLDIFWLRTTASKTSIACLSPMCWRRRSSITSKLRSIISEV